MIVLLVCVVIALFALAEHAHKHDWLAAMSSRMLSRGSDASEGSSEHVRTPRVGSSLSADGSKAMIEPPRPVMPASDVAPLSEAEMDFVETFSDPLITGRPVLFLSCGHTESPAQRLRAGSIAYCFRCAKWQERV